MVAVTILLTLLLVSFIAELEMVIDSNTASLPTSCGGAGLRTAVNPWLGKHTPLLGGLLEKPHVTLARGSQRTGNLVLH